MNNSNNNSKYHLFPKILFKAPAEIPRQTLTERPTLPKLRATVSKLTPQQPSGQRPGSVVSERVLRQFPKFCLNSQQLSIEQPSPQIRLSETNYSRYSRVSIIIRNEDGELMKKPTRRQKVNSLHTWVPNSLSMLSPTAADAINAQPLLILPLQSTRSAIPRGNNRLQAEVLMSCPTQYDATEESPVASLDNLEEKHEFAVFGNESQCHLEGSLSNNNSHCTDHTLDGSARSTEEEGQQKCLSSRTNLENSVEDLNQQVSKQSVKARRKLKIIKKTRKEKKRVTVAEQSVEDEGHILKSSRNTSPENVVSAQKIEEDEAESAEIESEEKENAIREEVDEEGNADSSNEKRGKSKKRRNGKRKNSNKEFKIRKCERKISILLQNSYYKEDSLKHVAEKKKSKEEDALFFLNESSSSDDNMFIEYVKTVKRNEKMRSLQ